MRDVVHIRLLNGDELIAYVVGEDDSTLILESPLVVEERVDQTTGGSNIILSKYVLFNDSSEVPIRKDHIITRTKVMKPIARFYKNSLVYNEKYINKAVIAEIEKVNAQMEKEIKKGLMSSEELLAIEDDEEFLRNLPVSSKTVH